MEVYQKISSKLRFKISNINLQSGKHKNKRYIYLYLCISHSYIYWCTYRWQILDSKLKDKCHPAPTLHSSPYPKKTRLVNFFLHFKIYLIYVFQQLISMYPTAIRFGKLALTAQLQAECAPKYKKIRHFKASAAVQLRALLFWDVTQRTGLVVKWRFATAHRCHLHL